MSFTDGQIQELSDGMQEATKQLEATRVDMSTANAQAGELLARQTALEKSREKDTVLYEENAKQLVTLADRMDTIALQHTNFVHASSSMAKSLGSATDESEHAYRFKSAKGKGSIFQSRQQAIELGMFFMATMPTSAKQQGLSIRQGARAWLKENKEGLRFLPNVTESLVKELSDEWLQGYRATLKQKDSSVLLGEDLAAGTNPGALLTRPEFVDTMIRNVEEHGVFRQDALIWPMGSDLVHFPRRTGGLSVFWAGEAATGSETDPNFDQLSMTAKKMLMIHQFSSELSEDAAISLADILMFEFALAIANEEDRIGFNGDGTGGNSPGFAGFTGVLGSDANATEATADANHVPHMVVGATGNDLSTEMTEAKLREMTGRLHTWAEGGAKFYGHRSFLADIFGISTGNAPSVVNFGAPAPQQMMGYPIKRTEVFPSATAIVASTKCLALGDLRKSWVLGDRRQPTLETSDHFAFTSDQITVRMTARIAFLMTQGEGMVIYKSGAAS